jgi:lipopolysaccharide transport system permease protein
LSAILSGVVDLAFALLVLFGMMFYYGVAPSPRIVLLPAFIALAMVASLGVGLILGTLNVKYRDVGHAVPFLLQFGMFATPIIYPASLLTEQSRLIAGLNPMAGVAEGFRWAIFESAPAPGSMLLVSGVVSFALLIGGALYFRRMEATFADDV